MENQETVKKTLADLSQDEIRNILNIAMDDSEWHTPSASDIKIHTQHSGCIYGYCNISKHNTYHDKEVWFNINWHSVQIWVKEYVRGKIDKSLYRPINNMQRLCEILTPLKLEKQP